MILRIDLDFGSCNEPLFLNMVIGNRVTLRRF